MSAPQGHIVHPKPEAGGTSSGKSERPRAARTKATHDKLEAGTTYSVAVGAQNESGQGERVCSTFTLPETRPEPNEGQQRVSGPPGLTPWRGTHRRQVTPRLLCALDRSAPEPVASFRYLR